MLRLFLRAVGLLLMGVFLVGNALAQQSQKPEKKQGAPEGQVCVDCHREVTPKIVSDWQLSKHSQNEVNCTSCHGDQHTSKDDAAKAHLVLPETCASCHETQVDQFKSGKHSKAWSSMYYMPTLHWQPMAQIEGMKGCGGCHRLGIKTEAEVKDLVAKGSKFGVSSCDTCHTRHIFSVQEAKSPQACQTCHMGVDHPQWEMYSTSKHGTRFLLRQAKVLPEEAAAPSCQTCHMQEGDHGVRTSWGYLAVRLPMPDDQLWAAERTTILQGLGLLDASGKPTPRFGQINSADVIRQTQADWQRERDKISRVCGDCHSPEFARLELAKGDQMIREADRLMAEALQLVGNLYKSGILKKPENYASPFPDLLTFHDAPTVLEQRLFKMFLEHRMRTFQGAFHSNPTYSFWYGWSEMQLDLAEIKEKAIELEKESGKGHEKVTKPELKTPKKK